MHTLVGLTAKRIDREVRVRTQFQLIYRKYRDFTMCPRSAYVANLTLAYRYAHVQGSVVECGTWRGGMIAGIAELLGGGRTYHLFDSFEGLPRSRAIDGPA